MSTVPWHYIRPNHSTRYPRRIVTFDAEAIVKESKQGQTHSFRCAAASFDLLDASKPEPIKSETTLEWEPEHLWEWITARCKRKGRLVCFAHNLAYDLRLTGALEILPRMGWELKFLTLDGSKCVARYSKDDRSLVLTDTTSYMPGALEQIAQRMGMAKAPLPKQNGSEQAWAKRCLTDVDITREAVLRMLRWFEDNECGMFRLTGSAQAMACYRHRFMPHYGLLAHRDPDALEAERRAAWTGRCEVWRHGLVDGPLYEYDFHLAYLHIAASSYLPTQLQGEAGALTVGQVRQYAQRRCVLVEGVLETSQAVAPVKNADGILWPTGRFRTTLWDVELQAALERGATFTVERSWLYKRHPALVEWAQWLLALLADDGLPADALERLWLKHWARALVGRFGMRRPMYEKVATLPNSDLRLEPFVDLETGEQGAYLQSGHDWFERSGLVDAPDSMPAVMGYIMAVARVNLLRLIEVADAANVVYLDTDSVIVDREGGRNLEASWIAQTMPPLRLKGTYRHAELIAPRQLILEQQARISGVPSRASMAGPRTFHADVWEGLAESVRLGRPSNVKVSHRAFKVKGRDHRRRHLAGGETAPYELIQANDCRDSSAA